MRGSLLDSCSPTGTSSQYSAPTRRRSCVRKPLGLSTSFLTKLLVASLLLSACASFDPMKGAPRVYEVREHPDCQKARDGYPRTVIVDITIYEHGKAYKCLRR